MMMMETNKLADEDRQRKRRTVPMYRTVREALAKR
jgi:hypothetical protein